VPSPWKRQKIIKKGLKDSEQMVRLFLAPMTISYKKLIFPLLSSESQNVFIGQLRGMWVVGEQ
jgi:hypothetical protein